MRLVMIIITVMIVVGAGMVVAQTMTPTDVPGREDRLDYCRALGVYSQESSHTLASPDGTYVAAARQFGSHGCQSVVIYACELSRPARASVAMAFSRQHMPSSITGCRITNCWSPATKTRA